MPVLFFGGRVMFAPVGSVASAMDCDLGEDEFSWKAALRQMGCNSLLRFLRLDLGVQENQHGWASTTQGRSENARVSRQFLYCWQKRAKRRAIGLMDAVFQSRWEQVGTILGEGRQQKHGVLDVGDRIGSRVLEGKDAARLLGRKRRVRDGEQERPTPFGLHLDHLGLNLIRHASYSERAHPAGGSVVGMVLAHGGFADDAVVLPAEVAEMHGQRNPCQTCGSGRAATFGDGNFVVDVDTEGRDFAVLRFQHLAVGGDDKVVLHPAADLGVAALGGDEEVRRTIDPEAQVEIHRESGGVEGRPEISRARWQGQSQGAVRR
jgi:hypothetical protein